LPVTIKRRLLPSTLRSTALRFQDTFVKMDGTWLVAEHLLYVNWLEERAL